MSVNKIFLLFSVSFFFLFFTFPVLGQTKKELEKQKVENLKKIREAEKILKETTKERNVTIGQLNALNQQIEAREALIKSIGTEVVLLNNQIAEIVSIVGALETDLVKLKQEYASMIYAASKASKGYDKLTFIFSAQTFNQFLMRLKYMQQYSEARKNQIDQIEKVRDELALQKASVENKKLEKNTLLTQQVSESKNLLVLKSQQRNVINLLSKKETEIRKDLAETKKAVENLDKLIEDIIKAEIAKTKNTGATNKLGLTPEAAVISSSFEGNKARMLWPVASGFISSKFGIHPNPALKGVMDENLGVGIQTNKDEKVRAVFDGTVKAVAFVPGMNNVVIIQHGEYHTVYAKITNVVVRTGQEVKGKDILGEVYTNREGISELQFQVWKNDKKLDPQTWLLAK